MFFALRKLVILLFLILPALLYAQGEGCFGETFVQLISDEEGRDLRPTCILYYPGGSGDLLLGGTVGGDIFLSRIDAEGKPRWRRIILTGSESTELSTLNELIIDRAGMIAGVGATFNDNLQTAYCFRYDPNLDQLSYFLQPEFSSEATGISEINGGEYLITGSKRGEPSPIFISALLHRINARTGQPTTSSIRYDFLGDEAFLDATLSDDGSIYAVGNVSATGGAGDIRAAVSKLTSEGVPIWTKIGPAPTSANARLYAFDLEIMGDKIYVLHWGNIGVITGGLNTAMMMSRFNASDGSVDWTRRYDITDYNGESPIELIAHNGKLYAYGFTLIGNRDPWLMQLDQEGTVLQTTGYPLDGSANVYLRANQQLSVNDTGIQLLASLSNPGGLPRTGMVLSLDNNGQSNNECLVIEDLSVEVSSLANGWTDIPLEVNTLESTWLPAATDRQSSVLVVTDDCLQSCDRCETTLFSRSPVCRGDSLLLNSRFVSIPGIYADTFPGTMAGCDSIQFTELAISDGPQVTYSVNNQCGLSTAEVRLSVTGGEFPYSYRWSDPTASGESPSLPSGNYRVTVNDAIGCRPAIVDVVVDLSTQQALSFDTAAPTCPGDSSGSISLVPAGQGSLRVLPNGTFLPDKIDRLTPGDYAVILRDSTGCEAFRQVTVPEALPLQVSINAPAYVRLGETVNLSATSSTGTIFTTYNWSTTDSISCEECPVAQFMPVTDAVVHLQATNDRGCTVSDSLFVHLLAGDPRIYLPTAFSPNGDGINDYWLPGLGPEFETVIGCQVFNRWGGMIWEYSSGEDWWDGAGQSPGTFTVRLSARLINGELVKRIGTIVLVR